MFDSRGFLIKIDGIERNCLLPFVDFLNTSHFPILDGRGQFNDKTNCFEIRTLSNLPAGNQVFMNYGAFPNRELLMYYGYLDSNNPYDRVMINFELPEDGLADQKLDILTQHGLGLEQYVRIGQIPTKLLAALRISLATDTELAAVIYGQDPEAPLSARNEKEIISTLAVLLEGILLQQLEARDDDLDEDMALLAEDFTPKERLAIQYKLLQKEILQNAISIVANMQQKLN